MTSARLGAVVPATLGLAVSVYLSVEHYTAGATLACPASATVNCAKVTSSRYSHLFGVPVALGGALYFAVMLALLVPPAWRHRTLAVPRVVGAVLGAIAVVYLLWAELFGVGAICLWCTAVHVLTVWLFAAVLWYAGDRPAEPAPARVTPRRGSPAGR